MSGRAAGARAGRELALAVALAAVGAGLTLGVVGQPWGHGVAASGALRVAVHASGRDATPVPAGLGLLALAGGLAVLATRRMGRAVVGALLLLAGLGIAAAAALAAVNPRPALDAAAAKAAAQTAAHAAQVTGTAWPYLAVVGGVIVAGAGAFTLARGRGWPGMSGRYDTPRRRASAPAATPAAIWDALDRGDDPT